MRIGFVSDAHGNAFGLRRCLDVLMHRGVDRIHFLGDAVGYLPGERAVLALLGQRSVVCQSGNHEAMLLGRRELDPGRDEAYRLGPARARLSPDELALVGSWPALRELDVDGRRVLLVHGTPSDHLGGYLYPDGDLEPLVGLGYDAIFTGNTHRPFVARQAGVLIGNVGSCGLPRDQGDLAACAIYDSATDDCEILRVAMPTDQVLAQFPGVDLHPVVSECLRRQTAAPVGAVVSAD